MSPSIFSHRANGSVGQLLSHWDGSQSPLGPIAEWPSALVNTVRLLLPAQAQIVLFWGPDYVALYNDAYSPSIGNKHPEALGRPAIENWRELWSDLEPMLRSVMETGETVSAKDRPFYIERHGYGEEVFFDISYSAVPLAEGGIGGVLCIVNETTERVRARRQMSIERDRLAHMFEQAPSYMALLSGPDHQFQFINKVYQSLIGHRNVVGKSVAEALPEVEGQGFVALLDKVYASGEPFVGRNIRVALQRQPNEAPETRLLDFVYQPLKDADGRSTGIFVEGNDVTEAISAIRAQRDTEERLRVATEAAAIGIWDLDPVRNILTWDRQCKALFGLPTDADVTYEGSFLAGLHPDDRERTEAAIESALTPDGSGRFDVEYRVIGICDGVERWIAASGRSLFESGRAVRFSGTVIDISTRKQAELALMVSEAARREESEALEILNRTAATVAAELDLDRLVQTIVDAGVKLSGARFGAFFYNVLDRNGESYMLYSLSGVDRAAFADFPMPRNTEIFAPTFSGAGPVRSDDITRDKLYGRSLPHRGMPSGHLPVRSYLAVPVVSRSGEVIGGLFFGHEEAGVFSARAERLVTGLAAQGATGIDNARLFQAAQRLNQTLETRVQERTKERDRIWTVSRDLLGVADFDGVWRSVNPAWTRVLGWEASDIVGRSSEWLEHPDDRAKSRPELGPPASENQTIGYESRLRTRGGDYRILAWTLVPLENALHCVARDVTDERAQAAALAEAEERLRQSQKMETVGQLTGGIAHDFNNLLQIVTGNLEILQRHLTPESPRLRRAADNAMTGAKRAATLTQRLLAFSRRQPLAPKPVTANALVAGMSELLHRTLGETIDVATVLAIDLWRIEVDPNQLETAILNLAINARDAMAEGGRLTIETANVRFAQSDLVGDADVSPGQYVMIAVGDTGTGMDEATLSRAFEPFFTTKEVGKGTGLGLSMVYGFVKQSGGHVKIDSRPGHGTSVKIYMQRLLGSETAEEEAVQRPAPAGTRDETILVCEDDDNVRTYSVEVLRELGYRVVEANDGPSALHLLDRQDERVDLLFTDVVLPGGMTGAMLAERARLRRPNLKVLFTTGYARDAIVHDGRLDPGIELLTKPFVYAELAARIRDMLDG